jgi:short-subunit dehydrogenase
LHLIRAVLPGMKSRGFGAIVNIASIGGRIGVPHLASYCAGKFALVGLSEAITGELAGSGVAVTTVMPGLMRTGSHVNAQFKGRHEAEYAWFATLDSLPLMSLNAERAARQIVSALRQGSRTLTIGLPARAAAAANGIAPGLVAAVNSFATSVLPRAANAEGNIARSGAESRGKLPDWVTAATDEAAVANNEVHGHSS